MPRPKTRPSVVPTDEEILSYDSVPVSVAARYLGWTENNVRLALREGTAPFGIAIKDRQLCYKITPGGLVTFKRSGTPVASFDTLLLLVRRAIRQEIGGAVHEKD